MLAQWRRKLVLRRHCRGTVHEERKVHREGENVRREQHDWCSRTTTCGDGSQREDSRVAIYIPRLP